jgi:hypothetical protein
MSRSATSMPAFKEIACQNERAQVPGVWSCLPLSSHWNV